MGQAPRVVDMTHTTAHTDSASALSPFTGVDTHRVARATVGAMHTYTTHNLHNLHTHHLPLYMGARTEEYALPHYPFERLCACGESMDAWPNMATCPDCR